MHVVVQDGLVTPLRFPFGQLPEAVEAARKLIELEPDKVCGVFAFGGDTSYLWHFGRDAKMAECKCGCLEGNRE